MVVPRAMGVAAVTMVSVPVMTSKEYRTPNTARHRNIAVAPRKSRARRRRAARVGAAKEVKKDHGGALVYFIPPWSGNGPAYASRSGLCGLCLIDSSPIAHRYVAAVYGPWAKPGIHAVAFMQSALIGAVEAGTLELNRDRGIHLAYLLLMAFGASGDRVVAEGLVLGEVIAAILAAVMIGRHTFLLNRRLTRVATVHILVGALTRPRLITLEDKRWASSRAA